MAKTSRQDALAAYVRAVADALGLRDWHVTYVDEPPGGIDHENATAAIRPTRGRKWASLWVPARWWDESPEDRRQTIAHELLHLHFAGMERMLETVQTNLGDAAWGVLRSAHLDALELAVDGIADAIAPHLPLPPETAP